MVLETGVDKKSRDKSPAKAVCEPTIEPLVRELVKKRGIVKARLTKFVTYIQSYSDDLNALTEPCRINLKLRIQGAQSLYTEFNDLQSQIESNVLESNLDDQLTHRENFEDSYYGALALAESLLSSTETVKSSTSTQNNTSTINSIRLPVLSLPTFDGTYEHWLAFRDIYLSLVHNSKDLCDIQKFHYLKSSLTGSALLVIDALELTTNNYAVAWELLLNRYNNNRLLIHNHVKALFSIQSLPKESHTLIRQLIDTTLKNLRALKILGEPISSWDTLIIYILVSKLDKTTEREWEQFKSGLTNNDTQVKIKLDDLMQFLKNRADMLETLQASQSTSVRDKHEVNKNYIPSTVKHYHSNKVHCNVSTNNKPQKSHYTSKFACHMCKMNHPLYSCIKFLELDHQSKLKFINDNKLCENCLRTGHSVESCVFGPCRKCNRKHNSIIHPPSDCARGPAPTDVSDPAPSSAAVSINAHSQQIPLQLAQRSVLKPVLLSTALVEVNDKQNNTHIARLLLDNGSQRCFIRKSLCDLLDAPLVQSTHEIRGVGGSVTQCTQTCNIQIKSRINAYTTKLHCFVLPQITSKMPVVYENRANFCIPDNIQLADPQFLDFESIDILVGADKFWDLLTQGKIRLHNGPYLLNSHLGWILAGPINLNARIEGHIQCNFTQTTDSLLRRFWEIEEIPTIRNALSDEEKACEEHFVRTTTRDSDGRFCVTMPLKQSPEVLGETYPQAERCLLALEKRLQRSEAYKQMYTDFIREYIDLGHMTKVSAYDSPHFIFSHHAVFRESTTTHLRVVFNGSAASTSGTSLNDLQMVGSAIQGDLLSILLRFRQHRYVACADVAKMYRQVLIAEHQRDLQLILWRDSPEQTIDVYRLNRVTYGTASAAFLSIRCLKQLGIECTDPEVKRIINEDFYVDDMITGSHDKFELLRLCNETARTLQTGCFPLRKWVFNFKEPSIGSSFTALFDAQTQHTFDQDCNSKTLGICWNNYYDHFYFNSQLDFISKNEKVTKRSILSHVSQIYDPLGLLSPTIMVAKVLLQRLWLLKECSWDDEVPSDVTRTWNEFVKSLSAGLSTIRVPRYVMGSSNYTRIELHVYTDASQVAYGACCYIRTINDEMEISSRLLCSKGKVAPLKPLSIPRLELSGALVGAKLYDKVINSISCQFDDIVFWSDSTIVLGWLRMPPHVLKTFVQNRVTEIHELTKGLPWRHVSGKENPSDLVSRGVTLEDLAKSSLWWEGPEFLRDANFNLNKVPQVPTSEHAHEILPEVKPNVNFTLTANTEVSLFPFERFSQFSRMVHAAAYVLRFINNTRNKNNKRTECISVEELRESTKLLTRLSQLESFPDEYKLLVNKQTLKPKHNLSKLNLFMDDDRVMRVGGRIGYSEHFSYDKKHPILITSKHHFTVLLFSHTHKKLLHAAPQALLFELQDAWWPLGGRNLARKIYYDCVTCKRLRGKTLTPFMGNLPKERITPTFPFLSSGVDYAGPVYILNRKGRGAQPVKAYICLFVCFVTRAIHLELVSDMTTDAYLLALKRFIARRGKPNEIFSDNGRNFVGLMNDFAKFLKRCSSDIVDYATSCDIKFHFTPPYAPHFGSLWEAGVKSCKFHLRRVVGNAHLTFEEFSTVLTQIEAVLNSRPLSPMSADPHDFLPLSPAHFLVGRTLTSPASEDLQNTPAHRLNRYQMVEKIRQHFWVRWAKEYVSELQTRSKWRSHCEDLRPNTLVLIKDDNLPPLKWHLGRIINTIPGKDGVSRVADIQTASGAVRRAYTKICPLVAQPDEVPPAQDSS